MKTCSCQVSAKGTHYHKDTDPKLIQVLDYLGRDTRIRIWLGDTSTGKVWDEEHDVCGYIGRSTGTCKVPLMIHNDRSTGGPALLDHCILRVTTTAGSLLYQHPLFKMPEYAAGPSDAEGYAAGVYRDGKSIANFKTEKQANNWAAFMCGRRFSK